VPTTLAADIGDPDGYNIEIAYKSWLYKERARLEMRNDDQ